jgi:hypothetical protein
MVAEPGGPVDLYRTSTAFSLLVESGNLKASNFGSRSPTDHFSKEWTMRILILLLIVVGAIAVVLRYAGSEVESFDPQQQARKAKGAIEIGTSWAQVLERVGEPSYWRSDTGSLDLHYTDKFGPAAREIIREQLENGELPYGFSFLYKFSEVATFAVNFDETGNVVDIQEKESQKDLMEVAGG